MKSLLKLIAVALLIVLPAATLPACTLEPTSQPVASSSVQPGNVPITEIIRMYYCSDDKTALMSHQVAIYRQEILSETEQIVAELIRNRHGAKIFPDDLMLIREMRSGNVQILNFNAAWNSMDEFTQYCAIRIIASTLNSINNIEYICITVNNTAISLNGKPVGLFSVADSTDLVGSWNRYKENQQNNELSLALFFPDTLQRYIIAEVRQINAGSDVLYSVLEALSRGPYDQTRLNAMLPKNIQNSYTASYVTNDEHIILTLDLHLDEEVYGDIIKNKLFIASLVATVKCAVPDVRYVRLMNNGKELLDADIAHDGNYSLEYLEADLGNYITLYYPGVDGNGLVAVRRAVSYSRSTNVGRLWELLEKPDESAEAKAFPLPLKVTRNIIREVIMQDGKAVVDIDESFYKELASMERNDARMYIFAIVNTLCEVESINSVMFTVDSEKASPIYDIAMGDYLFPVSNAKRYSGGAL